MASSELDKKIKWQKELEMIPSELFGEEALEDDKGLTWAEIQPQIGSVYLGIWYDWYNQLIEKEKQLKINENKN